MQHSNIVYLSKAPKPYVAEKTKKQNASEELKFSKDRPQPFVTTGSFSPWQRKSRKFG